MPRDAEPTLGRGCPRSIRHKELRSVPHPADNAASITSPTRIARGPRVIQVMDERVATDKCRGKIAKGADDSRPKLTTRKARTAGRQIIHARSYAARIAEDLADCDENSK